MLAIKTRKLVKIRTHKVLAAKTYGKAQQRACAFCLQTVGTVSEKFLNGNKLQLELLTIVMITGLFKIQTHMYSTRTRFVW